MAAVERRIFAAGRHQEIGYATQGGVAWKSKSYEYFYNLAAVTVAFVGFAGLYIGFKQQQKVGTEFDVLLTENHFLLSFMVVGAALLPPLLLLVPPPLLFAGQHGLAFAGHGLARG